MDLIKEMHNLYLDFVKFRHDYVCEKDERVTRWTKEDKELLVRRENEPRSLSELHKEEDGKILRRKLKEMKASQVRLAERLSYFYAELENFHQIRALTSKHHVRLGTPEDEERSSQRSACPLTPENEELTTSREALPTTPPNQELTAFEKKRRANMAANQALMNDIAQLEPTTPKTPKIPRGKREKAVHTPREGLRSNTIIVDQNAIVIDH